MAEDTRNDGQGQQPVSRRSRSLREAPASRRTARPAGRRAAKSKLVHRQDAGQNASALARGFRLSTELVAGVLVGAFIGWALDKWLGISPWGMIVFLLLGFAAGVLNVIRAAGVSSGPGSGR